MYKMRMKRRRYAKWDMTFHLHISPVSKNSYTSKSTHPKATFQPQETGKLICATLELLHICSKVATKCGTPTPSKHYKNIFHLVVPCNVTEFTHLGINANRDRYTLVNNDTWKTPIQIARACRFHFYCNKKKKNLMCTSCSIGPVILNGMIAVGAFTFCDKTNLQRIVPSNSRQSKRAEKCQQ